MSGKTDEVEGRVADTNVGAKGSDVMMTGQLCVHENRCAESPDSRCLIHTEASPGSKPF